MVTLRTRRYSNSNYGYRWRYPADNRNNRTPVLCLTESSKNESMTRKDFTIIENEDGIVIYDESDDYVPEENQIVDDDDELDMEYILEYEKQQAAQVSDENKRQRRISAGVIAGVILFITTVCYINFINIIF